MNYKQKLLYRVILIIHSLFCCCLFLGWLSNKELTLEILLVSLLITLTLFYLCNGCIISKIERYLSNSNFTVIDPLFQKFNIKLTKKKRRRLTLLLFGNSLIITLYKLYI